MIYSCSWNKIIARIKGRSQRWEEGECNETDDSSSSGESHASGDVNHSLSRLDGAPTGKRVALEDGRGWDWWWRCSRLINLGNQYEFWRLLGLEFFPQPPYPPNLTAIEAVLDGTSYYMMSWTQVYVTGLAQTVEPSDEDLEHHLAERYNLRGDDGDETGSVPTIRWAGPGTTLFKRDKTNNACRGYAFICFLSLESAEVVVERINSNHYAREPPADSIATATLPPVLRAELSKPQKPKPRKKKDGHNTNNDGSDIRLRRRRAAPIRKHPVIVSSDKKKTGLGNKTK